jgi:hypothetical protein
MVTWVAETCRLSLFNKITCLLTYLLQVAVLPWESNRFLAGQEIPRLLWNTKVHYRTYKCPPPDPILSHIDPIHALPSHIWRYILILSYHLCLDFPSGLVHSGFPTKPCIHLYSPPYMLHAPSITLFSIWSPEQYLVRNGDHQAPHYVVFSTPLLPRLS